MVNVDRALLEGMAVSNMVEDAYKQLSADLRVQLEDSIRKSVYSVENLYDSTTDFRFAINVVIHANPVEVIKRDFGGIEDEEV